MAKKRAAGVIPAPVTPVDQRKLQFSLRYIDLNHPKFSLGLCPKDFLDSLLTQIVHYQSFTVDLFTQPDPRVHRHPIYFTGTTEPDGFPNIDPTHDENLWTDTPWQFGLTDGDGHHTGWRVHGFISDEFFYIVWLDPDHKLDP